MNERRLWVLLVFMIGLVGCKPVADTLSEGNETTAHSDTDAITTDDVTTEAITTDDVTTDAITTDAITTDDVTTDDVTTDAVTTDAVTTDDVTTDDVTTDAVTTDDVTTDAITTDAITTDDVTTDDVTPEGTLSPNAASLGCGNPLPEDRRFPLPPWPNTNFCLHSVPYEEILYGGVPKDRIASIDAPIFQPIGEVDLWLADEEPVIFFELAGEARAYPLQVLVWHEIVNDLAGTQPIAVTYCPLCNSALVFERTVNGEVLDFGTSGNLRQADLIMYDRQTESWWQQFTGEAIVGDMTGQRLSLLPSSIISYGDFKAQFPEGRVLFPDTGLERAYGETPYINYDSLVNPGTRYLDGEPDDRLVPKMRVLALTLGDVAIAYPYSLLSEVGVVNDMRNGQEMVIFWKSGTKSALYKQVIAESKDVGSSAAFSSIVDGQKLTFETAGDSFIDLETSSTWNLLGVATDGPLAGARLTPISAHEFLWFAWASFQPETLLYGETE